jgi:DNA repair protein RadC
MPRRVDDDTLDLVLGDDSGAERPRERLMALGGDRVSDQELLAVVIGTGSRGKDALALATEIVRATGGLLALARASPRELVGVAGIGEARALRIAAAFHLGRRATEVVRAAQPSLLTPRDVWWRLRGRVAGLPQEVFLVLGLDAKNTVLEDLEISRGTLTGVDVHPRDVFRPLIRMSAAAAIVAHNHPSGDPQPSQEDIELTRRLRQAGDVIGIPILDHIILAGDRYSSIFEAHRDEL